MAVAQLSKMLTLLTALLIVASLADVTTAAKDFDWNIQPREGFPTVAFNNSTETQEIVFLFDTPLLYESKTYIVTLFEDDCQTIGSNAITYVDDASVDRELTVLVDVDQETISKSTYYTAFNTTNAVIGVCLRVDYLLDGESVNYHETNLAIDIDLTADFNLDSFTTIRVESEHDKFNGSLQFPVIAYHCDEANIKQVPSPVLGQGEAMQFCVELDPAVVNENVFVVNILSIDLDQEKMDLSVTHKNIIDGAIPNALTAKLCEDGICNIKTQLDSGWFSDSIPKDIQASGTAILAFGSLSNDPGQRFLRVPIVFSQRRKEQPHGSELGRELQQEGDDGDSLSGFSLSSSLKIPAFDWDITPREGFPTIAFNNSTVTQEIIFLFDIPLLYGKKTFFVTAFEGDCKTIGSNAITHVDDASVPRELTVLLDVDQETISKSTYYKAINMTNAMIGLCLRVDLLWDGESVNFHETNVTIDLDLTADFQDSFTAIRVESEQERVNANVRYPVVVYHCDESSNKLARSPVLGQGAAMQMCVELDPTVINEHVYVVDIMSVDLNQEKMDLSVTRKNIIDDAIPNALTSKFCQFGICNVKTQLDSSWFSDSIPGDIEASGTAILAFGSLSSGMAGQRFLRAPIVFRQKRHAHGSELYRELQQGADDGDSLLSTFILSTSLKIPSQPQLFVCAILVALFSCCCCGCGFFYRLAKRKIDPWSEEAERKVVPKYGLTVSESDLMWNDERAIWC
jgi:hypothetical protein